MQTEPKWRNCTGSCVDCQVWLSRFFELGGQNRPQPRDPFLAHIHSLSDLILVFPLFATCILKQKTGSGDRPPPPLLLLPCATYHHDRLIESCLGLVSKSAGTAWLKFLLHSRTFAETETGPDACSTGARLECFSSWFMRYQRLACKGLGRFVVVLTLCPSASDRLKPGDL